MQGSQLLLTFMEYIMKITKLLAITIMLLFSFNSFAKPLKVGFIYVSPIGDSGWTYQHDLGRQAIEKRFGDKIQTKYVESVSEGPDAERVIRKLASTGYDLIFATSFGYMNPTLKVAKRFPSVAFDHATGYKTSSNMGNYSPRFYEGRYLAGIAAGEKTTNSKIGYVAAFPIPEVVRGINAFTLGAQSINPDVEIKVVWTNSWFDPGKESEAALSLIAQGADVLTHHTDSIAVVKAAQDKGKHAIAYHSNMQKHGKDAQIGAVVHKWDDFYTDKVYQVLNKSWKAESLWYGIKQGVVEFVITADTPNSIKRLIKSKKQSIVNGSFHPFNAPIVDQNGVTRLSSGTLSDGDLLSMDYFVKGVNGKLSK